MSLNGLKNIWNRIYELEESEFMLGYFRRFVKDEDYEKIVEMGKEEREKLNQR